MESKLEKFRESLSQSFCENEEPLTENEHLTDFIYKVNGTIQRMLSKGERRFLVCVDGSEGGNFAYTVTRHMARNRDSVLIFHAYRKEDLGGSTPPKYRPEYIRHHYESQMISDFKPSSRYAFQWSERQDGASVVSTLRKHLDTYDFSWQLKGDKTELSQNPPDFIVLGRSGRGGTKEVLGRNAMDALRKLHTPCIIAKSICPLEGPQSFIYAVNGSEKSAVGLEIVLQLVRSYDSLMVVHINDGKSSAEQLQAISDYYNAALQRYGPRVVQVAIIPMWEGMNLQDTIVRFVNSKHPDFFALAPRVKSSLSELSEYILQNVNSSIILCKN